MRKRWIQIDGELVPADRVTFERESKVHIVGDIEPYRAVTGDMQGKWIKSRKEHRAFLKRNGLVEVGNEKAYFTRWKGMSEDNPNLKPESYHEEQVCRSLIRNLKR